MLSSLAHWYLKSKPDILNCFIFNFKMKLCTTHSLSFHPIESRRHSISYIPAEKHLLGMTSRVLWAMRKWFLFSLLAWLLESCNWSEWVTNRQKAGEQHARSGSACGDCVGKQMFILLHYQECSFFLLPHLFIKCTVLPRTYSWC